MNSKKSGFTLFEILVTVIIMIVMAGLALPTLTKFSEGLSLRSAAAQLSSMMRLAQRYAINYNSVYRVDINPQDNWAGIYSGDTGGNLINKIYNPPSIINIATTTINGTSASDLISQGSVKFYGKGTASPACQIHIVRTNSFFSNVNDSFGATVSDAVTYYQSGYNYANVPDAQKEQCYTLEVNATSGRIKLYKYAKGSPWE
ncbi:prepilin-type N-terminal cleavage/methylation domain-containing protein [bacterium]|nr:prepilin-type N-terminal cleavage/methylation domain-containing protein [bacterium]